MSASKRASAPRRARAARHAAKPDLTGVDYEHLAHWRYLLRRFLVFSENAAQRCGLTAQQHQALLAIKGFGGGRALSTGELAERLVIHHHSAVGLLDRLSAKGLARRRPGTRDRRQVFIELTDKAEALLARLSATHREELRQLAPGLQALLLQFAAAQESREHGSSDRGCDPEIT